MSKNKPNKPGGFSNNYKKKDQKPQSPPNKAPVAKAVVAPVLADAPDPAGACWCFSALDTWFFRESRPMESVGGAQLQSVFPPPTRTVVGAIRSAIGNAAGVQWHGYPDAKQPEHQALRRLIGDANGLGRLSFRGPFVMKDGQRLYPVPLIVLRSAGLDGPDGKTPSATFTRLEPASDLTDCDLGRVQLPKKQPAAPAGAKPLEHAWLTATGLQAVLSGQTLTENGVVQAKDLFHTEERLGIGRYNTRRTVEPGLLYQTQHVRPVLGVAVGMCVHGFEPDDAPVPAQGVTRLGAEGRMAHWVRRAEPVLPAVAVKGPRLLLVLTTHAQFEHGWLPDGLSPVTLPDSGQTVWEGSLHGVRLRLLCAVVGKPVREGGWNLAKRAPRDMVSLTPAGSCYFCEVLDADAALAAQALHGQQIGQSTDHGHGELAVGTW
ncbi:MAG: hypothetical protein RLZZ352_2421 [Pseudomonadota bacterium]|jgi:CRISPR-associated protein Cmr3